MFLTPYFIVILLVELRKWSQPGLEPVILFW